jgi:hypothetical protein
MFFLHGLPLDGWVLSIVGPIVFVAQIACIIHVLKTGRPYWWIWLIFGIPLIGLAAYIYLEVRPNIGKLGIQSLLWRLKSSRERIAIRREQLEESSTVRNRLALADELHDAGRFDDECDVLADGLRGAFKDDATLLMRLSQAHLEADRAARAEEILNKTTPERSADSQQNYALLKARIQGRTGRGAEAERTFQEMGAKRKSEAPRYYHAEYLLRQGRRDEAMAILHDILLQYRRGTVVWRHQERKWYYAAKKLLKTPTVKSVASSKDQPQEAAVS